MSEGWYYTEGAKSVGPLTLSELKKIFSNVSETTNTLVWRAGFEQWQIAATVTEVSASALGAQDFLFREIDVLECFGSSCGTEIRQITNAFAKS